ncbi:competence/damage-inducible protein A [bacterium]|nr:competence/damage-inducible protein A [bacterium]
MKVEIITIGDELLWGQVADTNAVFLGRRLIQMDLQPQWRTTVGDNPESIGQALILALKRSRLILITGGLGPTEDDVTRSALAQALGRRLVLDEQALQDIRERLESRGHRMLSSQQSLALLPQGAKTLDNPQGTAPGLKLEVDSRLIYILPGVPREMQAIFEQEVAPALRKISTERVIRRRRLRTVDIGESALSEKLRGVARKGIRLSYLPQPWGVDLWLTAHSANAREAEIFLSRATRQIEERLEDQLYGVGEDTMERVVATLLIMRRATMAVAESCTGGALADRLTDVPGSSACFERGVVAYSNRSKRETLKVPKRILDRFGAVSQETAVAMAEGVRKISGTDIGLSTTGIAGPTGATANKPVGLVFVGLAHQDGSFARRFLFGQDRLVNKECCVQAALNIVRQYLLKL